VVLGLAIGLYVVEFIADKVPVDNIWDVIHTFIRPPAASCWLPRWATCGGLEG
jgi:hypothetical protein